MSHQQVPFSGIPVLVASAPGPVPSSVCPGKGRLVLPCGASKPPLFWGKEAMELVPAQRWTGGRRFSLLLFPLALSTVLASHWSAKVKRTFPRAASSTGASTASLLPPVPAAAEPTAEAPGCAPHRAQSAAIAPWSLWWLWAGSLEHPSAAFIHQPVNTVVQALLQVWFSHRRCGGCSFPAGVGLAAGGCNCFSHPTLIHLCR